MSDWLGLQKVKNQFIESGFESFCERLLRPESSVSNSVSFDCFLGRTIYKCWICAMVQEEMAEFRYQAFLEDCGLDASEFE